jgi:phosphatidylglycerophosphatase A
MAKQTPLSAADWGTLPGRKTAWAWVLGTFFGSGLLRPGPGTYGSALALLFWMAAMHLSHASPAAQRLGTLAAAVMVTLIGIPAATIVARESAREDPGHVVIDEAAGQLIALIAIPADWPHALLALLLFRVFDIVKPPPCRQLERLPRGAGIMLDDVAAGLYTLALGHVALLFWP